MVFLVRSVKFNDTDIKELSAIIKEKGHVDVEPHIEMSGIWLRSADNMTELRLLTLVDIQVIVSRVCFTHRRVGCMTAIFEWLKEFSHRNGIHRILIQSVETKEMANWCLKNGFHPDANASMQIDDFIVGNYLLDNF